MKKLKYYRVYRRKTGGQIIIPCVSDITVTDQMYDELEDITDVKDKKVKRRKR